MCKKAGWLQIMQIYLLSLLLVNQELGLRTSFQFQYKCTIELPILKAFIPKSFSLQLFHTNKKI